ncbi:hypothetical protein NK908_24755, partial [Salmonella enterica subsp. enterica serovar Typhimurium]|nr:hypothetical protein [Salmonella enterica subsp. enterica serovar Typhimurium]
LGLSTAQQEDGEARGASVDLAALAEVIPIESAARHPGRTRLPEHLPRSRTEHLPANTHGGSDGPQCGGALKHLGEDVS